MRALQLGRSYFIYNLCFNNVYSKMLVLSMLIALKARIAFAATKDPAGN